MTEYTPDELRDSTRAEKWYNKLLYKLFLRFIYPLSMKVHAGRVSTTALVNSIFTFCELYSGKTMFPYQEQFSKRVIRSVLENDGEEITALFSRQSGKSETISLTVGGMMIILPQLANMPMFSDDPRLKMFKDGMWVGIFAPSQRQAQITYGRIKTRIQSKPAQMILADPEFNLFFTTSNGQTVTLSNNSFATAISASDGSNIEGESFKLIILEECQDISNFKIRKCLTGDTRVLLSDGSYKRLDEVVRDESDEVVCYDKSMENLTCKTPTEFYDNGVQDVYKITLNTGDEIKATLNHFFYTYDPIDPDRKKFRSVEQIQRSGLRICVGVYTGENNAAFSSVKSIEYVGKEHTYCLKVEGRNFIANGMISSNSIHPMGAAYNASIVKIGTATTHKGDFYDAIQRNKKRDAEKKSHIRNHFEYDCDVAAKYNPNYAKYVEKERTRLGEKSDEFRMAYKLEWIIERGMFLDIEQFEPFCGEFTMERVHYDKTSTHVAGIDLGGKDDDTIVTMCEVNWSIPAILESRVDDETGEEQVYEAYNTYVKDWYSISNEPDYDVQYNMIMDYLNKWRLARIVCDATREASFAHRLRANRREEVIPYIFTTKSKSEIYKHLDKEISAGRARFSAGPETRASKDYNKFIEQLGDLQKGYSGQYMVVAHPDERGAHDDYPDSWALAVWGCSFQGEVSNTQTHDNLFRQQTPQEKQHYHGRNRVTARRRR